MHAANGAGMSRYLDNAGPSCSGTFISGLAFLYEYSATRGLWKYASIVGKKEKVYSTNNEIHTFTLHKVHHYKFPKIEWGGGGWIWRGSSSSVCRRP
jgi:hypothetical protein